MAASQPQNEILKTPKSNWGGARPGAGKKKGTITKRKKDQRLALERAIDKYKLTAERIVQRIVEGLDAERTVIIGSGDNAFADQVPDHTTRLKAASMGAELLGMKNQNAMGNVVNFNFISGAQSRYED